MGFKLPIGVLRRQIAQRTDARQQILSAIDEILDRLVFQADYLQRFNVASPVLITDHVARLAAAVNAALVHYQHGEYQQVAMSLAAASGREQSHTELPAQRE